MRHSQDRSGKTLHRLLDAGAATIDALAARHGPRLRLYGVAVLGVLAALRLGYEFHRLVFSTAHAGAIDLLLRRAETMAWFAGEPVYGALDTALYPPASYAMLWPLVAALDETTARWLWAAMTLVSLGIIALILGRELQLRARLDWMLLVLFLPASYAAAISLGNGQLTIQLVALILLVFFSRVGNVAGGAALALSMIKPTVSAPFVAPLLFGRRGLIVCVIGGLVYLGIALIAVRFQPGDLISLYRDWLAFGTAGATWITSSETVSHGGTPDTVEVGVAYGSAQALLLALGLHDYGFHASVACWSLYMFWVAVYRRCGVWICLGVGGIVARVWSYHLVYDDLLLIFPLIACIMCSRSATLGFVFRQYATLVALVLATSMLVPATLRLMPVPWSTLYFFGLAGTWLISLVFLLLAAERLRRNAWTLDGVRSRPALG